VVGGCLAEGWGVRGSIQVVVMEVDFVACFDCLCLSWFALRYYSAFSLSLDFSIGLLVGRVFG